MAKNELGNFVIVTGIPFEGGDWLVDLFHRPKEDRVFCCYQSKLEWSRLRHSWWELTDNEVTYWDRATSNIEQQMDPVYDYYLDEVRYHRWRYEWVGDVHSFLPVVVPHMAHHAEAAEVVVMIRNGIVAIDELWRFYRATPRLEPCFARTVRRTLGQMDMVVPRRTLADAPFEWWCRYWASNSEVAGWLASAVPHAVVVSSVSVEHLYDADNLASFSQRIFPTLTWTEADYTALCKAGEAKLAQSPSKIWETWNADQREMFRTHCTSAMEWFGYEMPGTC